MCRSALTPDHAHPPIRRSASVSIAGGTLHAKSWASANERGTIALMLAAREIGAEIATSARIASAWVFGSCARGDARADSDLDVAVLLRQPESAGDAAALFDLAARLERHSPGGRVDIVILGPQGAVFRHRVLAEGVLVHDGDAGVRQAFEERTTRDYLDWKPTHDIAMRSTFAGLRDRFRESPVR